MKAVILAGGFGKRMGEIAKDTPKALLPVNGKPILGHILQRIGPVKEIEEVIVSTNAKFEDQIREWASSQDTDRPLWVVAEPATSEGEKLGSIGAFAWLVNELAFQEDIFCIFGDNLFDFDLSAFVEFYNHKKALCFGLHKAPSKLALAGRLGVVEIDSENKVTGFEEKPAEPKSLLAATGIYIIPAKDLKLFAKYLEEGNNKDAFGNFTAWLFKREPVYGFVFEQPWFDIGTPEAYSEAKGKCKD